MKPIPESAVGYDPGCRACKRLAAHLDESKKRFPDYLCAPVPPFGSARADLLVVGLAPGLHGANRTGRPFTGDHAGILLYATLHKFGFASHEGSADPGDGLVLVNCRLTNAVKCLPPENKPLPEEVRRCNGFLRAEILQSRPKVVLALGRIAHGAVLTAMGRRLAEHDFAHGAMHRIHSGGSEMVLIDSYHCSRYNTQTRRLTVPMFESVVKIARSHVDAG